MESHKSSVRIEEVPDDNILDDSDDNLDKFIEEIQNTPTDNLADLYIKSMQSKTPLPKYTDVDSPLSYGGIGNYTLHPSTSGYQTYSGIGKARSKYQPEYLDEYETDVQDTQSALDALRDQADLAYDCVKSTSETVDDLYERIVIIGDNVDGVVESMNVVDTRSAEILVKVNYLAKAQDEMKQQLSNIEKMLSELLKKH